MSAAKQLLFCFGFYVSRVAVILWYPFRLVTLIVCEYLHHGLCLTIMMCLTKEVKTYTWIIDMPIYTKWFLPYRKHVCCQHVISEIDRKLPFYIAYILFRVKEDLYQLIQTHVVGTDCHEAPGKCLCSYKWLLLPLNPTDIQPADYVHGIAVEYNRFFANNSICWLGW